MLLRAGGVSVWASLCALATFAVVLAFADSDHGSGGVSAGVGNTDSAGGDNEGGEDDEGTDEGDGDDDGWSATATATASLNAFTNSQILFKLLI